MKLMKTFDSTFLRHSVSAGSLCGRNFTY